MNFVFETLYDIDALTVMARAVRKTTHKKHSSRSRKFAWIVIVIAILFVAATVIMDDVGANTVFTVSAAVVMFVALVWEDRLNALIASKRMMKGSEKGVVTFYEDNYISATDVGITEFRYDVIEAVAKKGDYVVFVFSRRHAQVYDMRTLRNGTAKEFCEFIENKTGLEIVKI